jgi:hypothetical protein
MKFNWNLIAVLLYCIIFWIAVGIVSCSLSGCATFEYTDPTCHIKVATLGKNIKIDPNGLMSTISAEDKGIIEAVAGFVAGAAAFGL